MSWAVLAYVLLVAHLLVVDLDSNAPARFVEQIRGEAHKPYCLRPLAPFVARSLARSIPREAVENAVLGSTRLTHFFLFKRWGVERAPEYLAAFAVMYAGLLGALLALHAFLRTYLMPVAAGLGVLGAALSIPALYFDYAYLYDYPQLALFTLGLTLLARGRHDLLLRTFPVLCLSKETSVLLVLLFALQERGRLASRGYFVRLVALAAIWTAVRLGIEYAFRDNPGTAAEFHLVDYNLPLLGSLVTSAAWWPRGLVAGGMVLLVVHGWRDKPALPKHCLWMLAVLVPASLVAAYLDEWRDYAEVFPALVVLVIGAVASARRRTTLPDRAGP